MTRDVIRFGLVALFLFTGATHFTSMKHDFAAMVPPPLTGQLWVIYLTGVMEIAGGIGLTIPKVRRLAGICLSLLLLALFPANAYAAVNSIQFRGSPPPDIWVRALVQLVLLAALWWSTLGRQHG